MDQSLITEPDKYELNWSEVLASGGSGSFFLFVLLLHFDLQPGQDCVWPTARNASLRTHITSPNVPFPIPIPIPAGRTDSACECVRDRPHSKWIYGMSFGTPTRSFYCTRRIWGWAICLSALFMNSVFISQAPDCRQRVAGKTKLKIHPTLNIRKGRRQFSSLPSCALLAALLRFGFEFLDLCIGTNTLRLW